MKSCIAHKTAEWQYRNDCRWIWAPARTNPITENGGKTARMTVREHNNTKEIREAMRKRQSNQKWKWHWKIAENVDSGSRAALPLSRPWMQKRLLGRSKGEDTVYWVVLKIRWDQPKLIFMACFGVVAGWKAESIMARCVVQTYVN